MRKKGLLTDEYSAFLESRENDTAQAAREITGWLSGRYTVTKDLFLTQ